MTQVIFYAKNLAMKRIIIFVTIFILTFILKASAYTDIKAEVDKLSLTTDDTLSYKITITSTDQSVPNPALPKFDDFNVVSTGQTSTLSFVKNQVKTVSIYSFLLVPKNAGKFKIQPTQIKIEGDAYETKDFNIEVTPGKPKPKTLPEEKPAVPQEIEPQSGNPKVLL